MKLGLGKSERRAVPRPISMRAYRLTPEAKEVKVKGREKKNRAERKVRERFRELKIHECVRCVELRKEEERREKRGKSKGVYIDEAPID